MVEHTQPAAGDNALDALAADWPDWSMFWSRKRVLVCAVRRHQLPPDAVRFGLY